MTTKSTVLSALAAALAVAMLPLPARSQARAQNPHAGMLSRDSKSLDSARPEGEAAQRRPIMGDVIFPHDRHAEEFGVECEQCHHETNAAPLNLPHPESMTDCLVDCQVCHQPEGAQQLEPQACSNCHRSSLGSAADQTLSAKTVTHKLCWSCHEVATGAEATASCGDCHADATAQP